MRKSTICLLLASIIFVSRTAFAECEKCSPIKLGATLPLSGKLAFLGTQERDAFLMAVQDINKEGGVSGRKIEIIVEDNQGEAKSAVTGVNKLLNVDNVDVILSAFTHITQAIKDLVARKEKLLIYASSNNSIAESNTRFFKDYISAEESGAIIARAVGLSGRKKAYLLRELSDACIDFHRSFRSVAKENGISIVGTEEYNPGELDFRTILLKLKSSNPDSIVCCTWRDAHIIMKQMDEMGMLDIPTFHIVAPFLPEADTPAVRALYEKNDAISTWYGFVETSRDPIQLEFMKDFKARYGYLPRADAGFAYDDIRILAKALNTCVSENAVDQNCLTKALLQTEHVGVSGKLKFNRSGLSLRETLLMKVENGQWKELSR